MKGKWIKCTSVAALLVALLVLLVAPVVAISTTIVIGEFRTRGPSGGNDEFVEIYNLSESPVDISGWKLNGSNNAGTTGTRATVPASTILQPYQHYLFTNNGSSGYSGSTTGNQTYNSGITDDGGVAILNSSNTIIDQVGMSNGSAYKEGTILAAFTSTNKNQSYARKPDTLSALGGHKNGIDTDDNASDFIYNDGFSSPENTGSPTAVSLSTLTARAPLSPLAAAPIAGLVLAGGVFAWRRRRA